jgi:hypothetical protein
MQPIQLSRATLANLIHDLNHASDNDQPVSLTTEDGLQVKIGDAPWEHYTSPGHDDPGSPTGRPALYSYLDLSTAVVPPTSWPTSRPPHPPSSRTRTVHGFTSWRTTTGRRTTPTAAPRPSSRTCVPSCA